MSKILYVPTTPGGTPIIYGSGGMMGKKVASYNREQAIKNLMKDASHMPYRTWEDFERRGYIIDEYQEA